MLPKTLLVCGVAASLLYAAMNLFVPMQWPGYSSADQTVSELSAIGAPTRPLWVALGNLYNLLLIAFGCGVWMSAGGKRGVRVAGGLLIAAGVIGPWWPPMHLRGEGFTLTDRLHIAFTMLWGLFSLSAIAFSAASLGRRFRIYSIATIGLMLVFGGLTALEGPRIAAGLSTPWAGLWERIDIAGFLIWMVVLAITLLRSRVLSGSRPSALPPAALRATSAPS
jgi:hypothetical protein